MPLSIQHYRSNKPILLGVYRQLRTAFLTPDFDTHLPLISLWHPTDVLPFHDGSGLIQLTDYKLKAISFSSVILHFFHYSSSLLIIICYEWPSSWQACILQEQRQLIFKNGSHQHFSLVSQSCLFC